MPAETKTAPLTTQPKSLEGCTLECSNEKDRNYALDQAFDYRGDVTIELTTGESVIGFLSNRDPKAKPPRAEVFVKGSDKPRLIPYTDIQRITFSGTDTANGKSWHDWVNKKESERKAEAERIKQELAAEGHL